MADENDGPHPDVPHELVQVEEIVRHRVLRPDRPSGITVTPKIRRYYVVPISDRGGHEIPAARMVAATVYEDDQGCVSAAVIDEMQPQSLGEETMGSRS
jgi:hypothetical protein